MKPMKVMTVTWETVVTAREHDVRGDGVLCNLCGFWVCDLNKAESGFAFSLIMERVKINFPF